MNNISYRFGYREFYTDSEQWISFDKIDSKNRINLNSLVYLNGQPILKYQTYNKTKILNVLNNLLDTTNGNQKFIYYFVGEAPTLEKINKDGYVSYPEKISRLLITIFKNRNKLKNLYFVSSEYNPSYKTINHISSNFWLGKSYLNNKLIPIKNRKLKRYFLHQSRRVTIHRNKLYNHLKSNNIIEDIHISFASNDISNSLYNSVEGYPITDSTRNEQCVVKDYYMDSFCNLVFESHYKTTFFTEKIDKPLLAQQPFIVFSSQHYLKSLKELGFKTFDKWWDESYDEIEDTTVRLNKILKVIDYIYSHSLSDLELILNDMRPVLVHNHMKRNFISKKIKNYGLIYPYHKIIKSI